MNRRIFTTALCALTMSLAAYASDDKSFDNQRPADSSIRLRTDLHGPAINHETPSGHADFRFDPTKNRTDLTVEVENVNGPDGTTLSVSLTSGGVTTQLGNITLSSQRAELELRSEDGDNVPKVNKGDVIMVSRGKQVIETGVF